MIKITCNNNKSTAIIFSRLGEIPLRKSNIFEGCLILL